MVYLIRHGKRFSIAKKGKFACRSILSNTLKKRGF